MEAPQMTDERRKLIQLAGRAMGETRPGVGGASATQTAMMTSNFVARAPSPPASQAFDELFKNLSSRVLEEQEKRKAQLGEMMDKIETLKDGMAAISKCIERVTEDQKTRLHHAELDHNRVRNEIAKLEQKAGEHETQIGVVKTVSGDQTERVRALSREIAAFKQALGQSEARAQKAELEKAAVITALERHIKEFQEREQKLLEKTPAPKPITPREAFRIEAQKILKQLDALEYEGSAQPIAVDVALPTRDGSIYRTLDARQLSAEDQEKLQQLVASQKDPLGISVSSSGKVALVTPNQHAMDSDVCVPTREDPAQLAGRSERGDPADHKHTVSTDRVRWNAVGDGAPSKEDFVDTILKAQKTIFDATKLSDSNWIYLGPEAKGALLEMGESGASAKDILLASLAGVASSALAVGAVRERRSLLKWMRRGLGGAARLLGRLLPRRELFALGERKKERLLLPSGAAIARAKASREARGLFE